MSTDTNNTGARDPLGAVPRTRAMIVLVVMLVIAVCAWLFLRRVTESGLQRLARIEHERAFCDSLWGKALSHSDTLRVDRVALRDTIDPRSAKALNECGRLRDVSGPQNAREAREIR